MAKQKAKTNEVVILMETKLFYSITSLLILVLPFFYLTFANDRTLMPRLFLLDLFLAVILVILYQKKKEFPLNFSILRNPLIIVFFLNFVITFLSQFVAINFVEGFFDTVKTFTMVLLCFLLIQMFLTTPDWPERLSLLVLVAAGISLVIGFYQYFENVVFNTATKLPDGRPTIYLVRGLMSHKNLFSSGLMLMLPFIGYAIYKLRETLRVAAIIIFSLVIVLLVILETRAVWVGTLVGGGAFVFTLILLAKHFGISGKTRWIMIIVFIVSVGAFAGVVLSGGGEYEKTYLDRLKTITNPGSGNNSFRLRAWDATIEMIADHPIVGVGTGNWKIHSQQYFSDKDFKQTETNWIRPHNDFLWAYAERGLLGFLLYLALFVIPIYFALNVLTSKDTEHSVKVTVLLLLSGLLAYIFDSVFTFPYERINQQVYFTLFLAGITAEYLRMKPEKTFFPNQKPIFAITGLILLFSIVYGVSMLKSEYHIVRAKAAEKAKEWKMLTLEATKAKTPFRTLEPEASAIEYYIGNGYLGNGDLRLAADHFQSALKANPFDPFVLSNLGKIFTDLGEFKKGANHLERALKLLPGLYEAKVNLGTAYYNLKEYRKSLKVLNSIPSKQKNDVIKGNIVALKKLIAENPQQDRKTGENKQTNVKQKKSGKNVDSRDTTRLKTQKSEKTNIQKPNQNEKKKQNVDMQGKRNNQKKTDKSGVKKATQRDSTKAKNPNMNKKKQEKKNP